MPTRTELALAACEGLDDTELAKRGKAGFAKMIIRKRQYASAARTLMPACAQMKKQLDEARKELQQARATIAMLQQLDTPVTDTTQANELLADVLKKGG